MRAEQSWLEDEGVLMDRTARETALIRTWQSSTVAYPRPSEAQSFLDIFLEVV